MKKPITARAIAEMAGGFRQIGVAPIFRVSFGGKVCVLSDPRPGITAHGNPSMRTIHLKQDGKEVSFDGRYEFELATPYEQAISLKKLK